MEQRNVLLYNQHISFQNFVFEEEDFVDDDTAFTFVLTRESSRACFCNALHSKKFRNLYKNLTSWESEDSARKMGHKADNANVGSKVLPICDDVSADSNSENIVEKDVNKTDKRNAVTRMKEMLKWTAGVKSPNRAGKVLYFRNKIALKDRMDDSSSTSSKLSIRWDETSCSAASSEYSQISLASTLKNDHIWKKNLSRLPTNLQVSECDQNGLSYANKNEKHVRSGQWITTDTDFVVLEL